MRRIRIADLLHRRADFVDDAVPDHATVRSDGRKFADAVPELVSVARIDTQYADVYLHRARALLAPAMDEEQYRATLRDREKESALVEQVEAAIAHEAWEDVRVISARLTVIHSTSKTRADLVDVAKPLYEFPNELCDPFSPGLSAIAGVTEIALHALRDEVVQGLESVQEIDPEWSDLYLARRDAFAALQLGDGRSPVRESPRRAQADNALRAGHYDLLERLATNFGNPEVRASEALRLPSEVGELTVAFSPDTVDRAARVGLVPVHVASARHRVEGVTPLLWRPMLYEDQGADRVRIPRNVASDAPEALRERFELYLNRPVVNSGGGRNIPPLVDEDVLVETFDEPAPGAPSANPGLLDALGLPRRNGLSRAAIERALLLRGHDVVQELALDPRKFRLVCIPEDLHLRIGETRGWGTQPIWTHFDGRMVLRNHRSLVLAGGHCQYGGIYDLVGLGRDYDSERLFTRFAVVLRRRMAAW
jgi:hypothetical protein